MVLTIRFFFLVCLLITLFRFKTVKSSLSSDCKDKVCVKYELVDESYKIETPKKSFQSSTNYEELLDAANNTSDDSDVENFSVPVDSMKKSYQDSMTIEELLNAVNSFNSFGNDSSVGNFSDEVDPLQMIKNITSNETFTATEIDTTSTVTELSSTTTLTEKPSKPKPPTTPIPPPETFHNFTIGNDICLCDLTLSQCDMNCCCDKDCTSFHFKVFTKCKDQVEDDNSKYCFRSDFVFKNNTPHKMVKKQGGLFCIVRDNSKFNLNYQTKGILTSLESFNKSLPKTYYSFGSKMLKKLEFIVKEYKAGLPVWAVRNGEIRPFAIPALTVGFVCSQRNIKYLMDQASECSYQRPQNEVECGNSKTRNVFYFLKDLKIISNPAGFNKSRKIDFSKICQAVTCIGITIYICQPSSNPSCIKIPEKATAFPKAGCWNLVPKIQYRIWHNGTEGIKKFEAYVWLRNLSRGEQLLQSTEVKYSWMGTPEKIFEKSGNPGYVTGKPILAGKKIYRATNGSTEKREAIELSLDPADWLSVVGSEKGICSSEKRIPINFRENGQYLCSLGLSKNNFGKDKCLDLQSTIFQFLIGNDLKNATNENYFNKFVATYGNSRVEETGDWVQVLMDLYSVISSHVAFKSNYNNLMCKNIITDLYVDVIYANVGSFANPQSKILGVSFRFGEHKDLMFYCDSPGCESTGLVQFLKLSTLVHFFDATEPAVDAFAEPHGLEAKLPHDFFYPFFSGSCVTRPLSTSVLVLLFTAFI